MELHFQDIQTKGPSLKTQLLLMLLSFIEMVQAKQDTVAQNEIQLMKFPYFVDAMQKKHNFIDFAPLVGVLEGTDGYGQLPTPFDAAQALGEHPEPLYLVTSLCSQTRRKMQECLWQSDLRLYNDRHQKREAAILTLHMGSAFLGQNSVAQLLVANNQTLELALGVGVHSILDPQGVAFTHNERMRNREFPTSILLRYKAPEDGLARLQVAYTCAGYKRENHTQLVPFGLNSQPQFVL